jgi:hypothetical protein
MLNALDRELSWLESRQQIMEEVGNREHDFNSDYVKGYKDGIKYAAQEYGKEIKRLRQLLDGYMIEDVDLGGMEDVG